MKKETQGACIHSEAYIHIVRLGGKGWGLRRMAAPSLPNSEARQGDDKQQSTHGQVMRITNAQQVE